jgi:hypothetical protein
MGAGATLCSFKSVDYASPIFEVENLPVAPFLRAAGDGESRSVAGQPEAIQNQIVISQGILFAWWLQFAAGQYQRDNDRCNHESLRINTCKRTDPAI